MVSGREQLRAWMGRAKVNQRETAELLEMSEVYVSQILNGIRTPALDNAINIEQKTGIPVESWSRSALSKIADETSGDGPQTEEIAR